MSYPRLILYFILCLVGIVVLTYSLPVRADDEIVSQLYQIEKDSWNLPRNTDSGAALEEEYGIEHHKDGRWNCGDRAEVCLRDVRALGLRAFYDKQPNHVTVVCYVNGQRYELMALERPQHNETRPLWKRDILDTNTKWDRTRWVMQGYH